MNHIEFIMMTLEKQGIPLELHRAEVMTGPDGHYNLLLAIRQDLFNRSISTQTPNVDLDFRKR
jgi:hypothetical protein